MMFSVRTVFSGWKKKHLGCRGADGGGKLKKYGKEKKENKRRKRLESGKTNNPERNERTRSEINLIVNIQGVQEPGKHFHIYLLYLSKIL